MDRGKFDPGFTPLLPPEMPPWATAPVGASVPPLWSGDKSSHHLRW